MKCNGQTRAIKSQDLDLWRGDRACEEGLCGLQMYDTFSCFIHSKVVPESIPKLDKPFRGKNMMGPSESSPVLKIL